MRNAGRVGWWAGAPRLAWQGCFPHPDAPGEEAPQGRSFCSPLLLQTYVVYNSLSHSFCPCKLLLQTEQEWGDAETCAGAAGGVQFLGLLEEGSATHSHCACFSVSPLFSWTYSHFPQAFLFVFLLFFKCLFVWVELARVGVSGYGPLHSDLEKAQGQQGQLPQWPTHITHCCFSAFRAQLR